MMANSINTFERRGVGQIYLLVGSSLLGVGDLIDDAGGLALGGRAHAIYFEVDGFTLQLNTYKTVFRRDVIASRWRLGESQTVAVVGLGGLVIE